MSSRANTPEEKKDLDYWHALLDDCEPDCEPERDRWEETPGEAVLVRDFSLEEKRLSARCKEARCSASAFFTAAFACLTSVYTGQDDVLFITSGAGAEDAAVKSPGSAGRTMLFRMNLREQENVSAFLEFFNNPANQKKYKYNTKLEKELLYYFQKLSDIDRKEIIEFTKIKAKKKRV